jgi:NAD(P)-dependent dehydrogenase (short-subunit alcohol dehydrogenase family)
MIESGRGGAILMTTSISGQRAVGGHPYIAAKHGLTGLIRASANDLAPHKHPRERRCAWLYADADDHQDVRRRGRRAPGSCEPRSAWAWSSSRTILLQAFGYLASEGARAVTGQNIIVDAGFMEAQSRSISFQRDPDYLAAHAAE